MQNKAVTYARSSACALVLVVSSVLSSEQHLSEPSQEAFSNADPIISKLKPERPHGRGFKLEYVVNAPLEFFWNYKTNFDNELLHDNKYINAHKLVSREDNLVTTETEYSYKPKVVFEWQTTVFPDQYLLEYTLLNPEECGQNYHYGRIKLEAEGLGTRVTHISYFDFFGAYLWVNYPFKGGMSRFLKYTAQWEQQIISEIGHEKSGSE